MRDGVKNIAPSPEVQYLPAVFRRIQSGDIRMPAFQRGFVWDRRQIIELLESIYNGFPIGSVLLWKTGKRELNIEDPTKSNFPQVAEKFPVSYILDGLQRLSALYAVFHFDDAIHDSKFCVGFDLAAKEFVSAIGAETTVLPLNVLFRPTTFIQYHSDLQRKDGGSDLIQNAVDLLSTFQEYLLPIVTIEGRTATEVVQIFERINSTGARLGAVDFMRAVTWSEQFDLNRELDRLEDIAAAVGFDIPDETLMRVLAIALGYSTASDSMLQMRELSSRQLAHGVDAATQLLKRTLNFFREELQLKQYGLVPYEGQFLAAAGFYNVPGSPSESDVGQLARWFWTSSLNEDLQGSSEHKIARIVESMKDVRQGKLELRGRLGLTTTSLKERRFRWGGAISSALAAMFARNRARSLISGEVIDATEYLGADARTAFVSFADERAVAAAMGKDSSNAKVVANTVVMGKRDRAAFRGKSAAEIVQELRASSADAREILGSQFISAAAADAIVQGDVAAFLEARSRSILRFAKTLSFPGVGPN